MCVCVPAVAAENWSMPRADKVWFSHELMHPKLQFWKSAGVTRPSGRLGRASKVERLHCWQHLGGTNVLGEDVWGRGVWRSERAS